MWRATSIISIVHILFTIIPFLLQFLHIPATHIGYDELKAMVGGLMGRESIWIEIPDWFYEGKPISQDGAEHREELSVYGSIQRYFGKSISPGGVNEFLFGDKVKGVKVLTLQLIESSETRARGLLILEGAVALPCGTNGRIRHSFHKDEKRTAFEYIKPDRNDEKFPGGFGREFFRRYVPALRELGIKEIGIKASSVPSAGMNGAWTWCFYGFTNRYMKDMLQKYIRYLEDYYGIIIDGRELSAIMMIERMRRFKDLEIKGKRYAEEFLLGKRRGNMVWEGIIPDIFDEESIEMGELLEYLSGEE